MLDRTWIERDLRTRFPALAEQAGRIYDEYQRAVDCGELREPAVAWLQSCCQAQSNMVRDCAASIVGLLAERFPSGGELLLRLVQEGPRGRCVLSARGAAPGGQ